MSLYDLNSSVLFLAFYINCDLKCWKISIFLKYTNLQIKDFDKMKKYFVLDVTQAQNQRVARTAQDNLNQGIRMLSTTPGIIRAPLVPTTISETATVTTSEASEIPDNVTAELEKLEQEGAGPMVEVEGVSAILGDLADDDDELLGKFVCYARACCIAQ